ncbi:hypothetical protein HDU91_004005, partial [Kappamyces sp. JEL0680]
MDLASEEGSCGKLLSPASPAATPLPSKRGRIPGHEATPRPEKMLKLADPCVGLDDKPINADTAIRKQNEYIEIMSRQIAKDLGTPAAGRSSTRARPAPPLDQPDNAQPSNHTPATRQPMPLDRMDSEPNLCPSSTQQPPEHASPVWEEYAKIIDLESGDVPRWEPQRGTEPSAPSASLAPQSHRAQEGDELPILKSNNSRKVTPGIQEVLDTISLGTDDGKAIGTDRNGSRIVESTAALEELEEGELDDPLSNQSLPSWP